MNRRELLRLASGGGIAAALAATVHHSPVQAKNSPLGMPGLFPGKVVAVEHSGCIVNGAAQTAPVQQMVRTGIQELTGTSNYVLGWRRFVGPTDVVGIKINPNGNHLIRSSQALIMEVVDGLMKAGVRPNRIIVYERYNLILNYVRAWFPSWLRLESAADQWTHYQQEVVNYDRDHFVDYPEVLSAQDPNDPVARNSHLAEFLTKRVTKLINLSVLKTHQASGVTCSLKNLSHGLVNNVNRSHEFSDRNLTGSFIPAVVSHPMIRNKCVLNIMDGTNGLYHGGPYGSTAHVWPHKRVYFATDPVAADRVAWRVIDAKRTQMGYPTLEFSPADPPFFSFTNVQPQHISTAGALGLGEWRDDHIQIVERVIG